MTAPTDSQYKALILAQVGDDERQTLAAVIDGLWLVHSAYEALPGLRYLCALRQAIEVMQGQARNLVNTNRQGDRSVSLSDRFDHLQTMYDNTDAQIKELEIRLRAGAGGTIGTITRVRPISPVYATSEAAARLDRMLRGDAFLAGEWAPL